MPELLIILVMVALVRAIFWPWGSRAVCHDVFSSLFGGGPKASSSNFNSTPSTTVSPGLSATQFGKNSGVGGGVGSGGASGILTGAAPAAAAAPATVQPFSGSLADAFAQGATQTTQPDGTSALVFPDGRTFSLGGNTPGSSTAAPGGSVGGANSNFLGIPAGRS